MRINTAGVSIGMEPLPPGDYTVYLSNWRVGPSRSSGKPAYRLEHTVTEGQYTNRKVYDNGSLQQEHIANIKRALTAYGIDEEILEDPNGYELEEVLAHIVERKNEINIFVTIEESQQGQKNNRVRYKLWRGDSGDAVAAAADGDGFTSA